MERNKDWRLDREMTLPDWCFGRRYWVGGYSSQIAGLARYEMAEQHMPDNFVVWGIIVNNISVGCVGSLRISIRLGKRIPVNIAAFREMDRLQKGIIRRTQLYELYTMPNRCLWINTERQIIESNDRRLVFRTTGDSIHKYEINIGVQISAMTKGVPEWLTSGRVKSLL